MSTTIIDSAERQAIRSFEKSTEQQITEAMYGRDDMGIDVRKRIVEVLRDVSKSAAELADDLEKGRIK